jgi:quercetin dioxygenase-like cupin family protein
MELKNIPFGITDWSKIEATRHEGETGFALWKTLDLGCVRVRMIEYSKGYKADHWCKRGHILLVLEGEMVTELEDGRKFVMKAGTSYQVQHDGEAHRSQTEGGAKLFVVD